MDIDAFLNGLHREKNIPYAFGQIATHFPESVVYSQAIIDPTNDSESTPRRWISANYREVAPKVWRLAHYLISIGVKPGDRVAIVSYTRPEWMIADLAVIAVGAISVSIYQSVNRDETGYILFDSEAKVVFAENEEQITKINSLLSSPVKIPDTEDRAGKEVQLKLNKVITFEETVGLAGAITLNQVLADTKLANTRPNTIDAILPTALSSIVYTSGTTGPPKGVVQTHANHLANIWQAADTKLFAPEGDIFLFLPLAHSFARLMGYIGFLTPTELKFPAIASRTTSTLVPNSLMRDLREGAPQVVPSVPRILEKMISGLWEKAHGKGLGPLLIGTTLKSAKRMYRTLKEGRHPGVIDQIIFAGTASIRKKMKAALFGPRFLHAVSGGAKLPVEVNEFFEALGIAVYQGYGLTETCVATNVNRPELNKIGSVGPALREIEVKITAEAEICFKGPNITKEYYRRPTATKEAWDSEGWFHTGDLGHLDEDGYLYITGRKKELIVSSNGKKIAPAGIEERLVASRYLTTGVLFGDAKSYCVALVALDEPAVKAYFSDRNIELKTPLRDQPEVQELIKSEIEIINADLSNFETIKTFRILPEEPTIDNGLLTPTFKVKRKAVFAKYQYLLDEMY